MQKLISMERVMFSKTILTMVVVAGGFVSAINVNGAEEAKAKKEVVEVKIGKGLEALQKSQKAGSYTCLVFVKSDDANSQTVSTAVKTLAGKQSKKMEYIGVKATDATEADIIKKFGIDVKRSPMPLVLIVAPNGAVTSSFIKVPSEAKLKAAVVSDNEAKLIKGIQDGKNVVVCICNDKTAEKDEALKGVDEYVVDKASNAVKVTIDPDAEVDKDLLKKMEINKTPEKATSVLFYKGRLAATFKGKTTKKQFTDAVKKASSQGCGCGPGGC
jgi:hypothetical protein